VLKLSESGYYRWLKNRSKQKSDELLSVKITEIYNEAEDNDNYGVKRIHLALQQKGEKQSLRTVYRVMKKYGMLKKRRKPHGITKADPATQVNENLLQRDFYCDEPNKKILTRHQ